MTITRPPSRGAGVVLAPRCARCRTEAELGRCPGECGRDLCVGCYDLDDRRCHGLSMELRNQQIRGLKLTTPVGAIAERYELSRRRVWAIIAT